MDVTSNYMFSNIKIKLERTKTTTGYEYITLVIRDKEGTVCMILDKDHLKQLKEVLNNESA